jgi:cytochrome c oxidase assembly protein Cox11
MLQNYPFQVINANKNTKIYIGNTTTICHSIAYQRTDNALSTAFHSVSQSLAATTFLVAIIYCS